MVIPFYCQDYPEDFDPNEDDVPREKDERARRSRSNRFSSPTADVADAVPNVCDVEPNRKSSECRQNFLP